MQLPVSELPVKNSGFIFKIKKGPRRFELQIQGEIKFYLQFPGKILGIVPLWGQGIKSFHYPRLRINPFGKKCFKTELSFCLKSKMPKVEELSILGIPGYC